LVVSRREGGSEDEVESGSESGSESEIESEGEPVGAVIDRWQI
jgi:hypothetical protein